MTYGFDASLDFVPFDDRRLSDNFLPRVAPALIILATSVLFGVWTLYFRPVPVPVAAPASAPAHKFAEAPPAAATVTRAYGALLDPASSSGSAPKSLNQSFPLEASLEASPLPPSASIAEADSATSGAAEPQISENTPDAGSDLAPMPVPRPADIGAPARPNPFQAQGRRLAQQNAGAATAPAPADNRSIFDKLLGFVQPTGPAKQALAYAAPEDGAVGNALRVPSPFPSLSGNDRSTAVYDVAAHTVYMPDGTRLEAHSGLGQLKDDPRYVSERMRGPTPPSTYDLTVREQLFHGVKALRLTPVGGGDVYGRTGLLAHRYMLGPNGDSNGCVSFKDYNAFLQAYENGEVKRLVVVARRS